jgi:hypothetical protein
MNCQQHEADLIDLARSALDGGGTESAVRRHLGECPKCAARFERERQLTDGLRALAREAAVVEPNADAERRMVEMFVEAHRTARPEAGTTAPGRPVTWRWALAAAAGLVLFVGASTVAVRWHGRDGVGNLASAGGGRVANLPADSARPTGQAAPRVGLPPAGAPAPTGSMATSSRPGAIRPARAAARRAPAVESGAADINDAGEFVSLPSADRLPGFESGMIVRVELPVSSLPAYGLQIVPDAARTPVRADVLVGQDGQPRAIRLVSMSSGPRRIR